MIFLISILDIPNIFIKAENTEEARIKFFNGIQNIEKYQNIEIKPLTIKLLEEICPDEFMLTDDASF